MQNATKAVKGKKRCRLSTENLQRFSLSSVHISELTSQGILFIPFR
jgi:hypothetical protein